MVRRYNIVGYGKAGSAFDAAFQRLGYVRNCIYRRGEPVSEAAYNVDFVLLCVPDSRVAEVSLAIEPGPAVVMHCAGSLGLDVLCTHDKVGVLHPLVSLTASNGAESLLDQAHYGIAGESLVSHIVDDLKGLAFEITDEHRAAYHAAAVVACNHLVALLAQAERIAASCGVPLSAYESLVRGSIDNVFNQGATQSLTGPVARGDWSTVQRHLAAIDAKEQPGYQAGVELAKRLVEGANITQ